MPQPPPSHHLISGKVYDIGNNYVADATILVTHSSGTITGTSEPNGTYILNLSSLSWSAGDSISIKGSKSGIGTRTYNTTISSGGGQTQDIYLREESQVLSHVSNNLAPITKTILVSYDKSDITKNNPLPVQITLSEIDLINNPAYAWTITRSDGQPDSEQVTLSDGTIYRRYFTYNSTNILISRGKWEKQ